MGAVRKPGRAWWSRLSRALPRRRRAAHALSWPQTSYQWRGSTCWRILRACGAVKVNPASTRRVGTVRWLASSTSVVKVRKGTEMRGIHAAP